MSVHYTTISHLGEFCYITRIFIQKSIPIINLFFTHTYMTMLSPISICILQVANKIQAKYKWAHCFCSWCRQRQSFRLQNHVKDVVDYSPYPCNDNLLCHAPQESQLFFYLQFESWLTWEMHHSHGALIPMQVKFHC